MIENVPAEVASAGLAALKQVKESEFADGVHSWVFCGAKWEAVSFAQRLTAMSGNVCFAHVLWAVSGMFVSL